MANKHVKKCFTSLVTRKIQIKAAMKCYSILTRIAQLKTDSTKCWREHGAMSTLTQCNWECDMQHPLCKTVLQFLTKVKHILPIPGNLTARYLQVK